MEHKCFQGKLEESPLLVSRIFIFSFEWGFFDTLPIVLRSSAPHLCLARGIGYIVAYLSEKANIDSGHTFETLENTTIDEKKPLAMTGYEASVVAYEDESARKIPQQVIHDFERFYI